jgi:carbon-monoxide dehydrogenase large subunit
MIPAAQMVANALEDAVGIRVKSMPITAEKVGLALDNGNTEVE